MVVIVQLLNSWCQVDDMLLLTAAILVVPALSCSLLFAYANPLRPLSSFCDSLWLILPSSTQCCADTFILCPHLQGIAQFCLLAVVGMILGIAFGAVTSWLLDNIFRDATLTTIVTLVSAYSSYYVADRLVGASGLLAVVCNGFTMSLIGMQGLGRTLPALLHCLH